MGTVLGSRLAPETLIIPRRSFSRMDEPIRPRRESEGGSAREGGFRESSDVIGVDRSQDRTSTDPASFAGTGSCARVSGSLGVIAATTFVVWRRPNGSRSTAGPLSLALGARVPSDLGRLERMLILNAYYLPEACRQTLYPETTPVNSFRAVFDACLGGTTHTPPAKASSRPTGGRMISSVWRTIGSNSVHHPELPRWWHGGPG
jgi:hypothetical protein